MHASTDQVHLIKFSRWAAARTGEAMQINDIELISGVRLDLRLVRPSDAPYLFKLRTDPEYNSHLSPVSGTVEDQRAWIEDYLKREKNISELYYVISRKDSVKCGLVRIYDIIDGRFRWGSWILDKNKPKKAALESAIISFSIAFDYLKLNNAFIDVNINNYKAINFYQNFGMKEINRNNEEIFFTLSKSQFEFEIKKLSNLIN